MLAVMSVLLLGAGAALLGWSLMMLPGSPAYGFPWAFAGVAASFLMIASGERCLSIIIRGRRDGMVRGNDSAVMLAIFVIIAGILLLCFNSGVLPGVWKRVFFSWQMLVFAIGTIELTRGRFWGGGACLVVGAFFIIRRLELVYPDLAASGVGITFWPVLLIILGVVILCGIIFRPRRGHYCGERRCGTKHADSARMSGASGYVDISTVFGSNEQVYLDPVFQGGRISTVFGGVVLDLRRTELPEGDTYLKIESVFGGVEIYVPDGWRVEIRSESVFGAFSDKRFRAGEKTYDDNRRLVINASNIFGGGEIK